MNEFQIQLYNGHPIINDGKNIILIDTGAPSTIHTSDSLIFCLDRFECSTNYMGLTVSKISEMLGTEITTLLGADILSEFKILLDYQNQIFEVSKKEIVIDGTKVDISNFMGIPIVKMQVDDQELKFFLDTGAKLSYLSKNLTNNYESIGINEDFYPGVGEFQTECYEIPTVLGNSEFVVKYGNLPELLQMTLTLGRTDGIIGFDFFNNFKVVLDLQNHSLKFSR